MSDDRSPMDGWFRDEPSEPQSQPQPKPPLPFGTGSRAWDEYRKIDEDDDGHDSDRGDGGRSDGAPGEGAFHDGTRLGGGLDGGRSSSAEAPTQVSGLRVIRPDQVELPQAREPERQPEPPQQLPQQPFPLPEQRTAYGRPQPQAPEGLEWPTPSQPGQPNRPSQPEQPDQEPAFGYPEYQPHPHDRRGPARSNRKALIGGGAVAGVLVLGLIAYLALGNSSPKTKNAASAGTSAAASPSPTHTSFQPTSADPATAAEQTATAFLDAWQSGDLQKAAKYTDNPTDALSALNDYKSGLGLSSLTLKPQPAVVAAPSPSVPSGGSGASSAPSGGPTSGASSAASAGAGAGSSAGAGSAASPSGTVPFSATAMVTPTTQSATGQSVNGIPAGAGTNTPSAAATPGPNTPLTWTYSSSLIAYKQSDGWSVRWSPSILAPNLAAGQKLSLVAVPPGVGKITDAGGTRLSSYSETALQNIAASLSKKAPSGLGTPGMAVQIVDASGKPVGAVTTTLVKPVDAPVLKTTIDSSIESLARGAVSEYPRSSMVVLRPSTGAILAVANSSGSGDTALAGGLAPGSTFKIITSAALLNHGDVTLYTPVACPLTFTVQGVVYHNSTDASGKNEESLPAGTPFITDFAQSCNNAFTPFYKQLEGGRLASTAATYFGLNQPWDIGLGANTYFSIPGDSSGAELAQEDFGQGQVVASPLAMASVAATVGTGSFHQPYLVDGVTKATATALPSGTDANLKTLMHAVVTSGTAAGVFSSVSGTVYAKTGTAETDANRDKKPNAWMVAYDPSLDIALGVVVQDSGFGATFAGPEAAYVLSRL